VTVPDPPPVVSVRGEIMREVDPEIARLWVSVSVRDKQRSAALARLDERAESLRALLDGYGEAIERRETSGIFVRPEGGKRRGESVAAYAGTLSTTVTVQDFGVLGELVLALADQDQTVLGGPWWALRPDSPAYAEARRDAIDEAIARARTYADKLGSRLTRLVELADDGMEGFQVRDQAFGTTAGRSASGGAYGDLQLDPQRQTVTARIVARFQISEPTVFG
jgi:uncharacterized protein YggE